MDIAKSITKLRTSRLYTRKALAEKAGMTFGTLSLLRMVEKRPLNRI